MIPQQTGVHEKRDYGAQKQERSHESQWSRSKDGQVSAFSSHLVVSAFADHSQMDTRAFPAFHAHTHMINVATLPSLTFTAMQLRASLSYPAQSFIFLFFYSPILSPSVLFSRPLVRSHSFAHDPIFSRPGRLPLRGGSQARDPLLKQLLVELKRVPAHSPPPPHTHPHPLFSALRPLRCRSVLLSLIV